MNTAKPSIPSSNGGAADDLIEELARLMAQGAQENSSSAPPDKTAPATAQPELAPANSPDRPPSGSTPPPRQNATPAGAKAGLIRFGAARQEELEKPLPTAPSSGRTEPSSGLARMKAGAGFAVKPEAANTPAQDLSSSNSADATPSQPAEPVATEPGSVLSAAAPAPAMDAPDAKSSAANDPIADLIRSQSGFAKDTGTGAGSPDENHVYAAPQVTKTGETASMPRHGGGLDEKVSLQQADLQRGDKFRVPPVFGLSGKTSQTTAPVAPVAPAGAERKIFAKEGPAKTSVGKASGGSDALNEIESLIGNAVRVDFSDEPDPVEPSVQDKNKTPPKDKIDSAEDAILQAMAAIGKSAQENLENLEKQEKQERRDQLENSPNPPPADDFPDIFAADGLDHKQTETDDLTAGAQRADTVKTSGGRRSRFLIPLGAGIVLIGAILGGYWVLTSSTDNGDAPVLVADSTPSKQAPAAGQNGSGNQSAQFPDVADNSAVSATADANATTDANANERLVSRDQSTDAIGNEIRRVITADTTETGLANRRVRTVTVRPDGTIISGDGAVAGGQVLPVVRPNVPQLPANALNPELTNTSVAALPAPLSLNDAPNSAPSANSASSGIIAPIPRPRPANRAALAATSNSGTLDLIAGTTNPAPTPPAPIASTTPSAAPGSATNTTPGNPTAWVQMASRRSQDAATQSAASLQAKYASLLGGAKLEVKRIDLGERGIFYRVLLPAPTLNEASSLCDAIKNAGGDCFTRNN